MVSKTSFTSLLFITTLLSGQSVFAGNNNNSPRLVRKHDGQLVPKYHGFLRENSRAVSVKPKFHATDGDTGKEGDICGYEIYPTDGPVPFGISIVPGSKDGSAIMSVLPGYNVDFEEKQNYEFDIAAYDCGKEPNYSHRIPVAVEVEDINEFSPEFPNATYEGFVNSGKINSLDILTVRAIDGDASVIYKEICHYEITSARSVPFSIDKSGTIRPTMEFDYSKVRRFDFDVVAEDCGGMRSSRPAHVIVHVLPPCSDHITGVPDSIFYHALSGRQLLFPNLTYTFCSPSSTCKKVESATTTVTLVPKDESGGAEQPQCNLDNVSLIARRKYCKVAKDTVLLPVKRAITVDQETDFPLNDAVMTFDGTTKPIAIDRAAVLGDRTDMVGFGRKFLVYFWLRRTADANERYPTRQHILCYENGTVSNVDIAVRGCSLQVDVAINAGSMYFWTWSVPQLCNGRWHHYAIALDAPIGSSPQVTLYIDGLLETNPASGPGIADFVSNPQNDPQIRIGGCPSYPNSDYLIADLADLNLLLGQTESLPVIRCLSDCHERLTVTDMRHLKSHMTMSFNADNSQLVVAGSSVDEVVNVIRDVQYSNTHLLPEYGDRDLTVDIKAICASGQEINVPHLEAAVSVSLPYETSLLVGGLHGVFTSAEHFSKPGSGVRLFPDLTLSAKLDFGHSGLPPDAQLTDDIVKLLVHRKLSTLTECVVTIDKTGRLMDDLLVNERIVAPIALADKYGLDVESDSGGQLLIRGAKRAAVYQRILRQIDYATEPTDRFAAVSTVIRRFSLTCAYDDTRIMSSTYSVELTIAGEKASSALSGLSKNSEFTKNQLAKKAASIAAFVETGNAAGIGVALLIVIAVSLIAIAVIIIACRRRGGRRGYRRRGSDISRQRLMQGGKDDMEWDNSGFNVVVNPLSGGEDGEVIIHDAVKGGQMPVDDVIGGENYAYEGDEEYLDEYDSDSDMDEETAASHGDRTGQALLGHKMVRSVSQSKKIIPVPPALVDEEAGHDVL